MEHIFSFKNEPKKVLHKIYKDHYGYYYYKNNGIYVHLFKHKIKDEDELISEVCDTIAHEYLHCVIWQCRKNLEKKDIYDFFEEKIIAEATKGYFDEEDYYHLVQLDG